MSLNCMKQMFAGQAPCPGPSSLHVAPTAQPGAAWETIIEAKQSSKLMKVLAHRPPPSAAPNIPTSTAPCKEAPTPAAPYKEIFQKFCTGMEAIGIETRRCSEDEGGGGPVVVATAEAQVSEVTQQLEETKS
ncbi:hypothetical protein BHE74_00027986 [Ensete ventricosum]|nr:hypothetical protein BHE74_00027986 [Ensete ventricosum]